MTQSSMNQWLNAEGSRPQPSTTPSATSRRTSRMALFSRVGCTRLVSRMIKSSRVGSIQTEVPVNPVCPNEVGDNKLPAELPFEGVSQPRARLLPSGKFWRAMNFSRVLRRTIRRWSYTPPFNSIWQKSGEVARIPKEPGVG